MPKPATAGKAPPIPLTPTRAAIALARDIHAFFNALSMREDVVFTSKEIGEGLEGANIKAVAQAAGVPPEVVAFAATISEADCVWDFIDRKQKGAMAGSAGGRFVLPSYRRWRWHEPDESYRFPKGSRYEIIDTHVDEGLGFAFEAAPEKTVQYVFSEAGEEGKPVAVAPTLEGYLRAGLATGFAWYWPLGSKESKRVAKQLAEKAPLRQTVEVAVRSARMVDRRSLRSTMLKNLVEPPAAKILVKSLGATVPRAAKEATLYAALAEAVDALESRTDDEVLALYEADPKTFAYPLRRAWPTAANIRRALDVYTLGSSQPAELVELELKLTPLVPLPTYPLENRGLFAQALAGRRGSTIRQRLGETEFWDTTSRYGEESLGHAHVVPVLDLPFRTNIFKTPVKCFANASDVPGIKAGEKWRASAVLGNS